MKAIILHGTKGHHLKNWFPWISQKLLQMGIEALIPALPDSDRPSIQRYNDFLLSRGWDFDGCLLIGHSSGALAAMGLLEALPATSKVRLVVLAGVFEGDLGQEALKGCVRDFDHERIRTRAKTIKVIHSRDDPIAPHLQARSIAQKLKADFVLLNGLGHLNVATNPRLTKFPELFSIIRSELEK